MIQRQKIIETAKMLQKHNVRYLLGAKAVPPSIPSKLDCSGFVRYCFLAAGIAVPDGTYYQWAGSEPVQDLQIGDIGIVKNPRDLNGGINHIGIYTGNGRWIHCSYGHNGIKEEKTNIFKYHRRFKNVDFSGQPQKEEDEDMPKPILDWQKEAATKAIRDLAAKGFLNSPEQHIENLDGSNWALWVVQSNMARKEGK